MSNKLLDLFLRLVAPCRHKNQTWPMRLPGEDGSHRTCLECGRRQRYNLLDPAHGIVPNNDVVPLLRCLRPARPMGSRDARGKALAA